MGQVCPCVFCILGISLSPSVRGWEDIFAEIFCEFSSLSAQKFWCSCQPFPRFSVLFLPPRETTGFSRKRQIGRVCDSLPLVVAFTSKQHDSLLSYALHFPHIISHQMCCAGERAECRAHHVCREISPPPWEKCKKSKSFLRGVLSDCQGQQHVCFLLFLLPNWNKKRR